MSFLYALEMQIPNYPFAPVKLGFSRKPTRRVKDLTNGPFPTTCLGYWPAPNGYADEAALHARFKQYRLFGEWFYPCPDLKAFLRQQIGSEQIKSERSIREVKFEARLRKMFAGRDRLPQPEPFGLANRFIANAQKAIDSHMADLRGRWPALSRDVDLQCVTADQLADLLGVNVEEIRTRIQGIRVGRNDWRYSLRDAREFFECTPQFWSYPNAA